jgi:serine/threonine protein kinase
LGRSTQAAAPSEPVPPARSGEHAARFVPGTVIAERYRLIRELGEGGMGVVWVAHSLVLGVDVAIKLIRAGRADPELASRMAREAKVTATLGHPAIVRVFDFGSTERGDPFLVMELAHGETLAALLRREGKLSAVEALRLVLPIVDGLRCAHERGIVHRDIKPENVFIARDTLGRLQPKLLDFGIAMLVQHAEVTRLTQVGEVLGSPEFMSPEQARGTANVDLRTDVWALCIVLYNMLTGAVPFEITNYNALMQAILHQRPVPTHERGAGDRDLWLILAKGLEKKRDQRWASMSAFGEALAHWLLGHGVTEDIAGNSLKAVWLAGKPQPSPFATAWRRLRNRLPPAATPRRLAFVAGVLVLCSGVFAALLTQARPSAVAAEVAPAVPAPVLPTAARLADGQSEPQLPAVTAPPAAASAAPAAPPASKRAAKGVRPSAAPTSRRPAAAPAKKSIRDFGI